MEKELWICHLYRSIHECKLCIKNKPHEKDNHYGGCVQRLQCPYQDRQVNCRPYNFTPKEEDIKMKYKLLRPITANSIWTRCNIKNQCFHEHFKNLLYEFKPVGLDSPIPFNEHFIQWMLRDKERIQWLIDYEFIQKIKEEVYYSIGDRFENTTGSKYILAGGLHTITLINLKSGDAYSKNLNINSCYKVTEDEFRILTNGYIFKKIKE